MVFTALQLGRASSFAPDVSKAKVSAARILVLLKLEPSIDTESPDGLKPVGRIQTMLLQRDFEELGHPVACAEVLACSMYTAC